MTSAETTNRFLQELADMLRRDLEREEQAEVDDDGR